MCTGSKSALIRSAVNICARNNSAGIRCVREASVLESGVPGHTVCARNNSAGIRCLREARVLGSGVPGHTVCARNNSAQIRCVCTGSQYSWIRSAVNISARNQEQQCRNKMCMGSKCALNRVPVTSVQGITI
jgi:hypothetical protein